MLKLLNNLTPEDKIEIAHQILLSLDFGHSVDESNLLLNQAIKDIEENYGQNLTDFNKQIKVVVINSLYELIDKSILEPLQTDASVEKADETLRVWRELSGEGNSARINSISSGSKSLSAKQIIVSQKTKQHSVEHKDTTDRLDEFKNKTRILNTGISVAENAFVTDVEQAKTDPRITYPCYKSFDEFINVPRLRSLNDYIVERINLHIKAEKDDYFLNLHRLDTFMPYQPGAREIWLTHIKPGTDYDYVNLNKTEFWEKTEAAQEFSDLMDFIATLPFKEMGRILIIYDNAGKEVPPHRDHLETEICNEFIWFRTNLVKPFYVLNHQTGEKKYVESYSAWFDTVNQFHGTEAVDGLSFSIRVDGKFTDEFRKKIPQPETNSASTPALWACLSPDI